MIKIEEIFEVEAITRADINTWKVPAQYTHLENIKKLSLDLPNMNSLHVVLPMGLTTVGKRFKMTLEEME